MIWLIGCKGMLGSEIARQLKNKNIEFVGTDREVDITDPEALKNYSKKLETKSYSSENEYNHKERQVKWIINCSAYTNVDKAEEEEELAQKLNEEGPRNLARLCRSIGAKLIHISTDYVFNGKGKEPYTEETAKDPLGVYGKTKALGEEAIQREMNQYYIIRTAWLYGFEGKNFVYTMTKLMNTHNEIKVVGDQKGSPTCAEDLAAFILKLINRCENAKSVIGKRSSPAFGIYHYTNSGETSWHEFATYIYKYGKKFGRITQECKVNMCTTEEYGAKVQRPLYSVLSKEKTIKTLGVKIPDWKNSLERFIKNSRFEIK